MSLKLIGMILMPPYNEPLMDTNVNQVHPAAKMNPIKRILRRFRMWILLTFRYKFVVVGKEFYIGARTHIRPNCVSVGDYSFIGENCRIASHVTIGNWVMVASNVSMVGGDHRFRDVGVPSICSGRDVNKEIVIEDDVWIGNGAMIMHGVRIGEGAIVAAGSLVARDVPAYSIVGAKPAEIIAQRFDEEDCRKHRLAMEELRSRLHN